MATPTNWIRNQPEEQKDLVIVPKNTNYKDIIALIVLIIGTLLVATGLFLYLGMPAALIALGTIFLFVGFALGFKG